MRRGEIVTLIGANGAGKSTTLKTVSGLLTPREGTIEFDGRTIAGRSPDAIVALGLVQVPEGRRIFPELSVEDNLRVGAYLVDTRAKMRATLAEVYARFPRLEERRRQFAGTLSSGEQQLLAFGRAMMSQPKLLMLDEPSLGLAPLVVAEVMRSICVAFRRDRIPGRAKCQPGVARLADRAYVMETGNVTMERQWRTASRRRAHAGELSRRESDRSAKIGTLNDDLRCFAEHGCSDIVTGDPSRENDHGHESTQISRRRSRCYGIRPGRAPAVWAQSRGPAKIGAFGPMSGNAAAQGQSIREIG